MANHEENIFRLVDGYLNGLLTPDGIQHVEHQCEVSPVWRAALDEARRRQELIQSLPVTEASEGLIRSTLANVNEYERRTRRRRRLTFRWIAYPAAACAAIIGAFHLYYLTRSATPYDLRVFGQSELIADSDASIRIQLYDRDRNRGLADVPVEVELWNSNASVKLASFRTGPGGTHSLRYRLPDWQDGSYELRVTANVNGRQERISQPVTLKRSWKLMLSTDKPVYQPGQTILARSLALRQPDLKPVAGRNLQYAITDPKGNVIFQQSDVTSRYGIASFDCPLATEIIEGQYTIQATLGDTVSRLAVDVKKYVLPKFKIDVTLDQPYYQPGQRVSGTVQADYYFGQPVAGGQVRVQATATDVTATTLADLTVDTDATGAAAFSFTLPHTLIGSEQNSGDAAITLNVEATDTAGQHVTKRLQRNVTANPIHVEIIPESGRLVRNLSNRVHIYASYPDGRPAQVRLAVSGLNHELQTGELGVASFEITPNAEKMSLTVRATDGEGRIGRSQIDLKCGSPTSDFLVRTDKPVYNGGETIHLTALGSGVQPLFIDLLKDGQTILTETIEMTGGKGSYQFDLPPDVFGTIELVAYRLHETGWPVRKSLVLYVRQANALTIASELDLAEYRPGDSAKLTLQLTNTEGNPTPGAVSLAAVDEAVFGVQTGTSNLEGTFFLQEQELLEPIYAIYPWTPNLDTSLPVDQCIALETALFTRASQLRSLPRGGSATELQAMLDAGRISQYELNVLENAIPDPLFRFGRQQEMRLLLQATGPHTLTSTSYPAKRAAFVYANHDAIGNIEQAWIFLGVLLAIGVFVALLLLSYRWIAFAIFALGGLALVVCIFLPSLSRAREHAKRSPIATAAPLYLSDQGLEFARIDTDDAYTASSKSQSPPVRVREWFPETLLWRPELITDDSGRVSLDIPLADSITTWRLSASAVSAEGRLGGSTTPIRVFQPFFVDLNLPVALTRGDEITIPVVVYNYLETPQTVELSLEDAPWFERLGEADQRIELAPGEVKSIGYPIRVRQVGNHELQVTARGTGIADAIKRSIEVIPNGRRVEQVFNGTLAQPAVVDLEIPADAIEGSARTIVKIYPSSFSQLLDGLEGIFQRPYGCFEQTSSTTYPNVLALDYLRSTGQSVPQVEAQAREYIHLGYQRLLGFEVDGGGFDWFGRPPANRTLTAYGLMEFEDMARVHDVDPRLITRTRQWLMNQRNPDGTWSPDGGLHDDPTRAGGNVKLSTTAYVAWSVYRNERNKSTAAPTHNYLLSHSPQSISDPYLLALVSNALQAIDPTGASARLYLAELEKQVKSSPDLKLTWWQQSAGSRTTFYGSGRSGDIETTALATLALIEANRSPATVRGALAWLSEQKDAFGTFHSTQATVLALKALLAGTGKALGGEVNRVIEITVNGDRRHTVEIPPDQADVVEQVDLSAALQAGISTLHLADESGSAPGYQVAFSYYVPTAPAGAAAEPLTIDIEYDRTNLQVGESVTATATVTNNMPAAAPMVILDLPIPAGFSLDAAELEQLVRAGNIAKYQVNPRSAVVYLRRLGSGDQLTLHYGLRATMPVNIAVPPAHAYEYYNPDVRGASLPAALQAKAPS